MDYLQQLIRDSATKWRITNRQATLLFWTPVVLTFVVLIVAALALTTRNELVRDVLRLLLQEDGPAEWLSAISFFVGGVIAFLIARRLRESARTGLALIFFIGALGLFFAAGEEISWGQRILDLVTPDELIEINDQNELTLHNIGFLLQITNLIMLMAGLYGAVAYLVNKRVRIEKSVRGGDYLFIPPFFLSSYFVFVFLFRLVRWTILTESNFVLNRLSEWVEMLIAIGIMLFIYLIYRQLRFTPVESQADV